jgi:hypothetical protein
MSLPPVALNIAPAPAPNTPLQQYDQAMTVQTLINQAALQKQQQEANVIKQQQAQQELAQQQIATQQAQQAQKDQAALRKAYADSGGDMDKLFQSLPSYGVSPQTVAQLQKEHFGAIESLSKMHKAQIDVLDGKNKLMGNAANAMLAVSDQPADVQLAEHNKQINALKLSGQFSPEELAQIPNRPLSVPELKALQAHALTADQYITQAREKQEQDATLPGKVAESGIKQAELDQLQKGLPVGTTLDAQEARSWMQQNPGKTLADYGKYKATLVPAFNFNLAGGANGGLSQAAIDQQADNYFATGKLPPVGRGPAGLALTRQIMQRASELHPGSLAEGSAEYASNKKSLEGLQKNFDQVTAFENTALKNLDQVAAAGAKVPDLSARFANVPVRMISSQMIGTPEMAAFKTALLTAQTEAAKVLSSSNASGVLSDSARHEAQEVLDGNLPFPAMMASINQLKTDFGNRHESYANQIADIQKRLGAKGGGTARPAGATHTGIGSVDKKKHWLDANGNDLGVAE